MAAANIEEVWNEFKFFAKLEAFAEIEIERK